MPLPYENATSGKNASAAMREPIYAEIGRRIKRQREAKNLSQAALARMLKLSRPALANIEAGRQRIYIHHLFEIAARLDTLPGYLVPKPRPVARDFLWLGKAP